MAARVPLPRLLLDAGLADVATLGLATSIAAEADVSLVHALCRWRFVSATALCDIFVDVVNQRPLDLDSLVDFPTTAGLHRQLCARLRVLPLWVRGGVLGLGMTDPTDDGAVDQVVRASGFSVDRLLVNDDALERALRKAFPPTETPRPSSPPKSAAAPSPSKSWPIPAPPLSSSSSSSGTSTSTPTPSVPRSTTRPLPGLGVVAAPPAQVTVVGPSPSRTQLADSQAWPPERPSSSGEKTGFAVLSTSSSARGAGGETSPPDQASSMDVVLGEASSIDLFGIAIDAGSAIFMDPIGSADGFAPISPLSSQSGSTPTRTPPHRTITPGPATLPMRAPPGARRPEEATREVDLRDTAALFNRNDDETHDGDLQVVQAIASDDRTIPDDNLLFLMRVLIIADGAAAEALSSRLQPRIKHLSVVPMAQAVSAVEQRRYDQLVVVDPPDTVAGSQVLATIAARAKNGVVIFTGIADFGRLPGVRAAFELPKSVAEMCERVVEVLSKRARGE